MTSENLINKNNFSSNFSFNSAYPNQDRSVMVLNSKEIIHTNGSDPNIEIEPSSIKIKNEFNPSSMTECKINLNLVPHECTKVINVDDDEGVLKMHKRLFKS